MSTAAANIAQLQTLPLPPAVSYFPQTWGWLALLLGLLGLALFFVCRSAWRWWHNRYRRAALAELAQLETSLTIDRMTLRQLPELLKRTALSMPGQPQVASLGGNDWQAFLQGCSTTALPANFAQQLSELAYAPPARLNALPDTHVMQLLAVSRQWLEHHHVAV
jgi:hypothetical protein